MIKASEDKTFPGAIVASLASPWGQAVSAGDPANTYFGSYREVFARDLYEAWTGLVAAGDLATARDATLFLFERQQLPDGSMPRNSLVNGKIAPDSFGTQLDETAYPILMARPARADRRRRSTRTTSSRPRTSSSRTARRSASSAGRSRAATRRRRSPPRSPAWSRPPSSRDGERRRGVGRGLAGRRRRLAALGQGLDRDDERAAARPPVLHPAVEDRRPERRDHLQRRQRRPDARPARGDRRRLPRARRGSASCRPSDPDIVAVAAGRRRDDQVRRPRAARAGTATTATATATGASDGRPWAPSGQGTGHLWPVLSAERGRARARDRRRDRRRPSLLRRRWPASPPASA